MVGNNNAFWGGILTAQAAPVALITMSTTTYSNAYATTDVIHHALGFTVPTAGNYTLNSVSIMLSKSGVGNNDVSMLLCTDNAGVPSASCTNVVGGSTFVTAASATKTTFTAGSTITLTAGATYWVKLVGNSGGSVGADCSNAGTPTAANGAVFVGELLTTDGGTNWSAVGGPPPFNNNWEVMATAVVVTPPVSASIVNLNDKAETFASELK